MKVRTIIAAAAAPLALGGVLLTATAASAGTVASSSDVSAYFYNPSGNALGGPQDIGQVPGDAQVTFSGQYLAKATEQLHNADLNGQTITITGHLNLSDVSYQGYDPSIGYGPHARLYFIGTGGSDGSPTQLGFYSQSWWANASSGVLDLGSASPDQGQDFKLTLAVNSSAGWSDWNGQTASGNATNAALFEKAASHVREVGLSFGGGYFFENGVNGTGGLTITSISFSGS